MIRSIFRAAFVFSCYAAVGVASSSTGTNFISADSDDPPRVKNAAIVGIVVVVGLFLCAASMCITAFCNRIDDARHESQHVLPTVGLARQMSQDSSKKQPAPVVKESAQQVVTIHHCVDASEPSGEAQHAGPTFHL